MPGSEFPLGVIGLQPAELEQVVRKLAQADRMLGEGKDVADVCRKLGVAEQTYYWWRNQVRRTAVPGSRGTIRRAWAGFTLCVTIFGDECRRTPLLVAEEEFSY